MTGGVAGVAAAEVDMRLGLEAVPAAMLSRLSALMLLVATLARLSGALAGVGVFCGPELTGVEKCDRLISLSDMRRSLRDDIA